MTPWRVVQESSGLYVPRVTPYLFWVERMEKIDAGERIKTVSELNLTYEQASKLAKDLNTTHQLYDS